MPRLKSNLHEAGVWIEELRDISSCSAELHLELASHAVPPLYTALVRSGLHLSRAAHVALAALCSRDRSSAGIIMNLRLEIRFLTLARETFDQTVAISA